MKITNERAIEILDPTHREHYSELPDGLEQVNEACRMGMEALKKQIPMSPDYTADGYDDEGNLVYDMASCPKCGYEFEYQINEWGCPFCPYCGQALDWSDVDEAD